MKVTVGLDNPFNCVCCFLNVLSSPVNSVRFLTIYTQESVREKCVCCPGGIADGLPGNRNCSALSKFKYKSKGQA